MGVGQVLHVDVVPDGGAVGGVVVGAEHRDGRHPAERRLHHQWHEVEGVGPVLADQAVGRRARRVEVAQAHRSQVVAGGVPGQHLLDHALRLAVRALGPERVRFVDRKLGRGVPYTAQVEENTIRVDPDATAGSRAWHWCRPRCSRSTARAAPWIRRPLCRPRNGSPSRRRARSPCAQPGRRRRCGRRPVARPTGRAGGRTPCCRAPRPRGPARAAGGRCATRCSRPRR